MLADSLVFIYKEAVDNAFGVISYNVKKVNERMQSWFRVIEKLHQDIIVGFNWF